MYYAEQSHQQGGKQLPTPEAIINELMASAHITVLKNELHELFVNHQFHLAGIQGSDEHRNKLLAFMTLYRLLSQVEQLERKETPPNMPSPKEVVDRWVAFFGVKE